MATVKDVTKEKQAKTVEDVNNQDARTRLWQSLNTTYSNQMEESDKAYDKSISQQNNAMLARGMGRSSYAGQISANMYNDKNKARNKLGEALIADYQNRIGDIEAQEKEDERWERQFAAQEEQNAWQRQYSENQFKYQQQRDTVADQQWQQQYNEQLRQFNENMAFQKQRANVSDAQWQKTYDENLRQFNEQMAQKESEFKRNLEFQSTENALNRAFTTSERVASQNFQAQQAQLNRDAEVALQKLNQQFQANENALSRQAQKDLQILSQNFQSSEAEKARAAQEALQRLSQEFQSGENAKNREAQEALQKLSQAFTAEQNALNRAQSQSQFEISQAFAERQWEAQQEQWKQQFNYQQKSDSQKIAFEYLIALLNKGEPISDDLMKQAGLTDAQGDALVSEATGSSGSPVITWRQAADAAAKKAGYTDRNDPKIEEDRKKAAAGNSSGSNGGIAGAIGAAYSSLNSNKDNKNKYGIMGSVSFD